MNKNRVAEASDFEYVLYKTLGKKHLVVKSYFCGTLDKMQWQQPSNQSSSGRSRFSDYHSELVQLQCFLLNWKTITTCFEHQIFHNYLNNNFCVPNSSYKQSRLLSEQESITRFFVLITKTLKRSSPVESIFNFTFGMQSTAQSSTKIGHR